MTQTPTPQEPARKKVPYEIFLDENPDFDYFTNYQVEPRIKELVCPECGAASKSNCWSKKSMSVVNSFYIHKARVEKFAESVGITREQLDKMPYRRWPEADSYEFWGCFPYQSGGNYAKKPKERFRTYEWAKECDRARDQYNASVPFKKQKPSYSVQPMAWCPTQKAYVRWDLIKKE